jgi:8-oxo-dGTP pyrophosphatase MutT (NUDIX family)
MKVKVRKSAGLAIIYDNKILLARPAGRKDKKSYGIPKGGIEKGESKLDAAIRETYEELGIKVPKSLINRTEHEFFVNAKKYGYIKDVFYFIVNITDLKQIGLKGLEIPTSQLQTKEISDARFMDYTEALEHVAISQDPVVRKALLALNETKTIGNKDVEPNQEINQAQQGETEDNRLHKIRRFKGKIKDFEQYWKDRKY